MMMTGLPAESISVFAIHCRISPTMLLHVVEKISDKRLCHLGSCRGPHFLKFKLFGFCDLSQDSAAAHTRIFRFWSVTSAPILFRPSFTKVTSSHLLHKKHPHPFICGFSACRCAQPGMFISKATPHAAVRQWGTGIFNSSYKGNWASPPVISRTVDIWNLCFYITVWKYRRCSFDFTENFPEAHRCWLKDTELTQRETVHFCTPVHFYAFRQVRSSLVPFSTFPLDPVSISPSIFPE